MALILGIYMFHNLQTWELQLLKFVIVRQAYAPNRDWRTMERVGGHWQHL